MTASGARELALNVHQEVGTLSAVNPTQVTLASGTYDVERAVSCLVEPEPGDRVLVAIPPEGPLFVLAVLQREAVGAVTLKSERDVRIESTGTVCVHGARGAELSGQEVAIRGVGVDVEFDRLGVVGRMIVAQATSAQAVLEQLDTVVDRARAQLKRSYRFVEELDSTRAREVQVRVKNTLLMRAANSFLSAERLVKLDGEQIHMG